MLRQYFHTCTRCALMSAQSLMGSRTVGGVFIPAWQQISVAAVANLKPPATYPDLIWPEKGKLKPLEKTPSSPDSLKPRKMKKRLIHIRGPELIHNKLIYKMYGIRALQGGYLKHGHMEMIRLNLNRYIDEKNMFAVWRVDAPWKPRTKKGVGKRMGGGKGPIHHYVTPVKAGRIVVELAGRVDFYQASLALKIVAHKLPFNAEVVSQEIMDKEEKEETRKEEENLNPFTFQYCLDNNILGSEIWAGRYDYLWYGKHR